MLFPVEPLGGSTAGEERMCQAGNKNRWELHCIPKLLKQPQAGCEAQQNPLVSFMRTLRNITQLLCMLNLIQVEAFTHLLPPAFDFPRWERSG